MKYEAVVICSFVKLYIEILFFITVLLLLCAEFDDVRCVTLLLFSSTEVVVEDNLLFWRYVVCLISIVENIAVVLLSLV